MKRRFQLVEPLAEPDAQRDQPAQQFTFRGPWFTSREAQAYVCCKTLNAFYVWKRRHGIVSRSNGTVSKRDLDRALATPRRHRMAPASLANLRKRA